MKNRKFSTLVMVCMTAVTLTVGLACAEESAPMTPEFAAKKEMVRKQQEQRITPAKRKAASDALKAERIKVYKAKQKHGRHQQTPPVTENK